MARLARVVGIVAALLCGVAAGRVLWSPLPADPVGSGTGLPDVLAATGAGVACAAIVAILTTAALVRRRSATLTTVVALAGLAVLVLPGFVDYPSEPAVLLYADAVAGGLVLGAASTLAARDTDTQAALAAGTIGALLLTGAVDERQQWSDSRGWTAYAPLPEWQPGPVLSLWFVAATATAVLLWAVLDRRRIGAGRIDARLIAACAVLPAGALVAGRILLDTDVAPPWWAGYVVVVLAVVAVIAWRLPGRDGRILFAGAAVLAAAFGGGVSGGVDPWVLGVVGLLVVAGTVLGVRFSQPVVGFVFLVPVAAAAVVTDEDWSVVPAVGFTFVLPAVAAYVVGSCLPTSAPAATVGLSLPFTVGIPVGATVVRAAGTRYADYRPGSAFDWAGSVPTSAAVVAVAVIVVCGVGAWGLDLRAGNR